MRKRIEHLFGEAKEQMGLRRAHRRGVKNLEEQCLMTAMAQNIKRIISATTYSPLNSLNLIKKMIIKAIEITMLQFKLLKSVSREMTNTSTES